MARADRAQMQQLVPDVQYHRKADRTHVFARTQLIYSLGDDDYLHHWIDRPLLVDPSLDASEPVAGYAFPSSLFQKNPPNPMLMSLPSYARMQQTAMKYGLDGFSFFPETFGRFPFYDYAAKSDVKGFQLLTEFIAGDQQMTKSEVIKEALANPVSFRIDGKVVVTSYVADSKPAVYWQETIEALKKQYGNSFIFLPSLDNFGGKPANYWIPKYHENSISSQDVNTIKEYLRAWLRVSDGLYVAGAGAFKTQERTFDDDFYQNFVIRLMKSVLAEPEFQQKYFGLSALVGHENNTRIGYALSSNGTKTLRNSFEAAMAAKPDLINIPEWDEQNENTSLRPTVYNGYSSMRIMRYYTSRLRGQELSPMPGDNTHIPDLIVSFRKTLVLGEKLDIELLNVPDSDKSTFYTAKLILESAGGKVVYTSAAQKFNADELKAQTISLPSEMFANYEVLRPKIEIESNGNSMNFEDGLHYIHLKASGNWDYKWVKQSLRDILKPQQINFSVSDPEDNGNREIKASFTADEPLQHVEVLDNDDVSYSYSTENPWRENADQSIFLLNWGSIGGVNLSGTITLRNANARWLLPEHNFFSPTLKDQTLTFDSVPSSKRRRRVLIAIPKSQIGNAFFDIDLKGIYNGSISIKELMTKRIVGIPGPKGLNLVFSPYNSQDRIPPVIHAKSVNFVVQITPRTLDSVLHLQAIGQSGRIYRSKPVVLKTPQTTKAPVVVYSREKQRPVQLQVDADRVPDIQYQFDPTRGSVLVADAGRPFWGILGGYFAQATNRGGANAGDDTPFLNGLGLPADAVETAPLWVKTEDGKDALQFNGKSTYISLPQEVIPRWTGWTLEMDINPETTNGSQLILANRARSTGSISVYMVDGEIKVRYYGQFSGGTQLLDTGIRLPAKAWSRLTIRYDQANLLLSVDGKAGKSLAISGPGVYDTASVIGGYGQTWFTGKIKSLRIRHSVD